MQQVIRESIARHRCAVDYVLLHNIDDIEKLCLLARERLSSGGKLFFAGNGGSAADSQHLAAEFVGRYKNERSPLPAIALSTDTSVLTAIANDYGYDEVFTRQVSALCNEKDVLIVISTSGNSKNLANAVAAAKANKTLTVGLLGKDGGGNWAGW
jgi:D-sedoheptulose 7-phosphate isomerase